MSSSGDNIEELKKQLEAEKAARAKLEAEAEAARRKAEHKEKSLVGQIKATAKKEKEAAEAAKARQPAPSPVPQRKLKLVSYDEEDDEDNDEDAAPPVRQKRQRGQRGQGQKPQKAETTKKGDKKPPGPSPANLGTGSRGSGASQAPTRLRPPFHWHIGRAAEWYAADAHEQLRLYNEYVPMAVPENLAPGYWQAWINAPNADVQGLILGQPGAIVAASGPAASPAAASSGPRGRSHGSRQGNRAEPQLQGDLSLPPRPSPAPLPLPSEPAPALTGLEKLQKERDEAKKELEELDKAVEEAEAKSARRREKNKARKERRLAARAANSEQPTVQPNELSVHSQAQHQAQAAGSGSLPPAEAPSLAPEDLQALDAAGQQGVDEDLIDFSD